MRQMLVHGNKETLETAIVHDGQLIDFDMERHGDARQLVGSLYKGKVINVLPGMQAAFVDIGLCKNAFLYIDDVLHPHLERQPKVKPPINELLHPGQELIVQVVKEPIGNKGARITTHYSLPGRFLVYMPDADYIGVSKKIQSEQERERLRAVGETLCKNGEGIILRTAADGEGSASIMRDVEILRAIWSEINCRAAQLAAPAELHRDAGLSHRIVRDFLTIEIDEVWIDDPLRYMETKALVQQMAPALLPRLKLFKAQEALFEKYHIYAQLKEAFERKIKLSCGGDLVWDTTEALTVIDVNTGSFVGTSDLEDTVFRTNMEAAQQLARLLRLRDVGGIIIVDFIDMEIEEHRDQVFKRLEALANQDRTKCQIVGWTRLGLLEMTRKKARDHAVVMKSLNRG